MPRKKVSKFNHLMQEFSVAIDRAYQASMPTQLESGSFIIVFKPIAPQRTIQIVLSRKDGLLPQPEEYKELMSQMPGAFRTEVTPLQHGHTLYATFTVKRYVLT